MSIQTALIDPCDTCQAFILLYKLPYHPFRYLLHTGFVPILDSLIYSAIQSQLKHQDISLSPLDLPWLINSTFKSVQCCIGLGVLDSTDSQFSLLQCSFAVIEGSFSSPLFLLSIGKEHWLCGCVYGSHTFSSLSSALSKGGRRC